MNRSKLGSFVRKAVGAPTLPGAYVLTIELADPIEVTLPGKPRTTLQAGRYLYCGSAKDQEVFARACRGTCDLAR